MEPLELINTVNDLTETADARVMALDALYVHLEDGGDIPVGPVGQAMHPTLSDEAIEFFGDLGLHTYASDIRARLAYGDE